LKILSSPWTDVPNFLQAKKYKGALHVSDLSNTLLSPSLLRRALMFDGLVASPALGNHASEAAAPPAPSGTGSNPWNHEPMAAGNVITGAGFLNRTHYSHS